jgi:cytochrome c oxidase cbb3-type subunit 3
MRACWVLPILSLAACKPATRTSPHGTDASQPDAEVILDAGAMSVEAGMLDGHALFRSLCAVCHAPDGTGYRADNAPSLVNTTFLESASDEQLRRSIVDGRPGTSMGAYGKERGGPLEADAIALIVAWIRSHGPATTTLAPRARGDAARGAPLYASHCEQCHGNAQRRGNAVHLANPRFLETASDAFIGWAITQGRPGTPMEPWQTKLTSAQIDDVVAYVRSFEKPAAPDALAAPTGKEPMVINPRGKNATLTPRSTPCAPNAQCTPDERFVPVLDVKRALDEKRRIVIIDARPPSEWMHVHIPGAVSIPYYDTKRLEEVPSDGTWVVAYCACPHHLSGNVVDALRKRGVKKAVILDEGVLEWQRRGYPIVAAPGVLPPPGSLDAGAPH